MKHFELSKGTGYLETAWEAFMEADYDAAVHEIPGTHDSIVGANDTRVEEAHMKALAGQLKVCIDQART